MNKLTNTIENIKSLFSQGWIVTVGLSGKDSFCVAHCALEALREVKATNPNVGTLYLVTTDTTLDNFEVHGFLHELHTAAVDYAHEYDLPVITKFLRPALSSTPMVEYIGRGKLLRTPQTTRNGRDCAVDWKIEPMKKYLREIRKTHQTEKVVALSGSRSEESTVRAANIEKRGETINTIASTDMGYTMAPIKDWGVNEVWSLIGQIEDGHIDSFAEVQAKGLRKHYAAGNGGTCDIFLGNNKASDKACGARFGCVLCSLVPNDKSLEQQILTDEKQYGYMQPFVDLRAFMNNTLHDMERSRSLVGRDIDKDGWLKINYNQYSMQYRQELLRYVLTIDVREREAAEDLGMAPRFQMITEQALIAIQYHWSREGGEKQAGEALRAWNDVYIEGKRHNFNPAVLMSYDTELDALKAGRFISGDKRGTDRFLHLDTFLKNITQGQGFDAEGLKVHDEYYPASQGIMIPVEDGRQERVVQVSHAKAFNVPELSADEFVNDTFVLLLEDGELDNVDPTEMLKIMLHHGIIELRRGAINRLHKEAKRAQAINAMMRAGVYFETLYFHNSVTKEERDNMQVHLSTKLAENDVQLGLF
jgi:DNA sulfur modification protein DndC